MILAISIPCSVVSQLVWLPVRNASPLAGSRYCMGVGAFSVAGPRRALWIGFPYWVEPGSLDWRFSACPPPSIEPRSRLRG